MVTYGGSTDAAPFLTPARMIFSWSTCASPKAARRESKRCISSGVIAAKNWRRKWLKYAPEAKERGAIDTYRPPARKEHEALDLNIENKVVLTYPMLLHS